MRPSPVLEERDVFRPSPQRQAVAAQVEEIALDPFAVDDSAPQGTGKVARLVDGELAAVDEEPCPANRLVVAFPHLRREASDEIEMGARLEPLRP